MSLFHESAYRRPGRAAVPIAAAAMALILTMASGCQTARMPLPETLSTADRMSVSGRQGLRIEERLRFGTFAADPVTRSWTRGGDRGGTARATASERRQTYRFTLREGAAEHWFVACHVSVESLRIDLDVVEVSPADASALYCNLQSTANPLIAWEMDLTERHGRPLTGAIRLGSERFDVVGTNRLESAWAVDRPTGYELRRHGSAVGAVEVINNGAVWLSPDLEPDTRRLLAAASAALLLLEDLYEVIDHTTT